MYVKSLQLCPTLCDPMDCSQGPLSMGFSRQGYWDLPNPGTDSCLLSAAQAVSFFSTSWEYLKKGQRHGLPHQDVRIANK